MPQPRLTIGMAHHNDFDGAYFTLQDFKKLLPEDLLEATEFIFVDQSAKNPEVEGSHSWELRNIAMGYAKAGTFDSTYIPYTERIGTSASRGLIFEKARAPVTMVVDCHIGTMQGATEAILKHLEVPGCKDIVSGPLLQDGLYQFRDPSKPNEHRRYSVLGTHYADHFRARMWGTWSSAWKCLCGDFIFATWNENEVVRYETVGMSPQQHKRCPKCERKLPMLGWNAHQFHLRNFGYVEIGAEPDQHEPFEISGQGLGLFACRTEAWPGFNPDVWAFGGEELYIHEKFRANGGKALCIPDARWYHKFPRPNKSVYPNTDWYKCRNYVLEFMELQQLQRSVGQWGPRNYEELGTSEVYQHFVKDEKKVPQHEWDVLVSDPKKYVHGHTEQHVQPEVVDGRHVNNIKLTVDDLFNQVKGIQRDLDQHLGVMREIASEVDHITEFGKRRESTIAFAASGPKKLVSYNTERDQLIKTLGVLAEGKFEFISEYKDSTAVEDIEPTDLLWIDTVHHADRMRGELQKFAHRSNHYIMMRGTHNFGVKAEGGGPGLWQAIREYVEEHPEWFVMYHNPNQYGLTILSRNQNDRPPQPIIPWPPGKGPGTELGKILKSIGIEDNPYCDCNAKIATMDRWGIAGCEENFDEIVAWMREGAPKWGWESKVSAGFKSIFTGLAFQINPLDPFPSIIRLAIDRAKKAESKS